MPKDQSFQDDSAYGSQHPPKGKHSASTPEGQPMPDNSQESQTEKRAREVERSANLDAPAAPADAKKKP